MMAFVMVLRLLTPMEHFLTMTFAWDTSSPNYDADTDGDGIPDTNECML